MRIENTSIEQFPNSGVMYGAKRCSRRGRVKT